jgi:hypothetical protein
VLGLALALGDCEGEPALGLAEWEGELLALGLTEGDVLVDGDCDADGESE